MSDCFGHAGNCCSVNVVSRDRERIGPRGAKRAGMNNELKAELRVTSVAHAGLSVGLEVILVFTFHSQKWFYEDRNRKGESPKHTVINQHRVCH